MSRAGRTLPWSSPARPNRRTSASAGRASSAGQEEEQRGAAEGEPAEQHVAPGAVGEEAAEQDAGGAGDQEGGEHGVGGAELEALHGDQRGDREALHAGGDHRHQHVEQQQEEDRRRQQQPAAGRRRGRLGGLLGGLAGGSAPGARAGRALQVAPEQREPEQHRQRQQAGRHQRAAPAGERGERHHGDRRQREAEVAGEGVDAEGAGQPLRRDAGRHDDVVGRMDHAVADSGEHGQRQHHGVAGAQAEQPDGDPHERHPGEQQGAGADPVGKEAGRDLGRAGGGVERGQQQAELGVADPELGLDQREQRRQREQIEVAQRMARAEQAEHSEVRGDPRHGTRLVSRRPAAKAAPAALGAPIGRTPAAQL